MILTINSHKLYLIMFQISNIGTCLNNKINDFYIYYIPSAIQFICMDLKFN